MCFLSWFLISFTWKVFYLNIIKLSLYEHPFLSNNTTIKIKIIFIEQQPQLSRDTNKYKTISFIMYVKNVRTIKSFYHGLGNFFFFFHTKKKAPHCEKHIFVFHEVGDFQFFIYLVVYNIVKFDLLYII